MHDSSLSHEPIAAEPEVQPAHTAPTPIGDARARLTTALSTRLRELRNKRGWTQGDVAQRIQSHVSAVSRWEGGVRLPSLTDLLALGNLYSVSCDELLGRDEQPPLKKGVLLDRRLLSQLEEARTTENFDRIVEANAGEALWFSVPDSARVVAADEAHRRARELVMRFPDSRHADKLFGGQIP